MKQKARITIVLKDENTMVFEKPDSVWAFANNHIEVYVNDKKTKRFFIPYCSIKYVIEEFEEVRE